MADRKALPALCLLLGVLGFSFKAIFIKLTLAPDIDGYVVMCYRALLSLPFFVAGYLFFRRFEKGVTYSFGKVLLCSALFYITSLMDTLSLERIPVSVERTILFTTPIFVLIFSYLFLKKTYRPGVWAATLMSFAGLGVTFLSQGIGGDIDPLGIFYVSIASATFAIYILFSATEVKKRNVFAFNSQAMGICCVFAPIPVLIFSDANLVTVFTEQTDWTPPILLALVSTVIPSFFTMYGMKHCGAVITSSFNNIGPFITMTASVIILGEQMSIYDMVGMIIVFAGVYYIGKAKK